MKLLRWGEKNAEKPGMIDSAGQIRDLSAHIDDISGGNLSDNTLLKLSNIPPDTLPIVDPDTRIGPCVGNVGKLICIGLNYADHAAEANMPIPEEPILFFKSTSAICGPNDDVLIPRGSTKTDWEVELGVVIGKEARYITEADAMDHVAGYCVVNDVSERAFQLERGGQWVKGKSSDTFAPIGPWLVTRDAVADTQDLDLWLEVDGQRYQNGNTATMIFAVPQLISYVSQFMSLQPGDIIATGTPPGVGMGQKPEPVYLREGQTMHLGIAGLGEQRQTARNA